ncbi:MAG: precorrin-4 C(11)-methyltransferase [Nitrospinae bacterium]|nr:precorrin-4 C(11)-methyltransferase [Nitrospinota bacterium]
MTKGKLSIVGAGPGAPDLITVRGKELVEEADIIVYAGSLVNPKVLSWGRSDAEVFNSAEMNLEEIIKVLSEGYQKGKKVVRLHTGDASIYGAIGEQMYYLDRLEIEYDIIPGVSSFLGAASSLKKELTVPEITQTVILSRCEGRTPVPERENLKSLAQHHSSMVLFLSATLAKKVEEDLLTSYPFDTPIAVVYKATWEEEKIYKGELSGLAKLMEDNNIKKTALIFIGEFLKPQETFSKLYDKGFTHMFRKGK